MNVQNNIIAPRLVSKRTIKKLGKVFKKPIINEPSWRDNLLLFYNDNIKPNLFAIIIFFLVFVLLTIKYLLKKEKNEMAKKKKIANIRKILLRQELAKQLANQSANQLVELNTIESNKSNRLNNKSIGKPLKKIKKKKSKSKIKYSDDDIYYRASDKEFDLDSDDRYSDEIEDDNASYYSLSKNYEKILEDNDGSLPVGLLQDAYEQKKTKMTFNELAKLISGN